MSTILGAWCGLAANLECMSEMFCTRIAGNIQDAKKSPSHHRTTLSGYVFATKAHIDNRQKLVKKQYIPHMSLRYGELRPTNGWDLLASLGHPSKFQQVSHLDSVTARCCSSGRQPKLRRWTERATYIRQDGHHVGHWPTFLVLSIFLWSPCGIWQTIIHCVPKKKLDLLTHGGNFIKS